MPEDPSRRPRWGRVGAFFALACAGSGLAAVGYAAAPGPLAQTAVLVAMMWTPALAAIAVRKHAGEPVAATLGLRLGNLPWTVGAVAAPLVLYLLMLGIGLVLPGVTVADDPVALLQRAGLQGAQLDEAVAQIQTLPLPLVVFALAGVIPGGVLNLPAALGEELGWRGLLFEELRGLGGLRASLLTGVLWGLWHAPIIAQGYNFPDQPLAGVFVMVAGCVALSPVMHWLRERSDSVLSAALFHGAFNAGGQVPMVALAGPGLVVHPLGLLGILAGGLCAVALLATGWGRALPPAARGAGD